MSFVCYETDDRWEIGWESTCRVEKWMGVATADSQQKAFEICNYLNGGMPSVGMDILGKLTNRLGFNSKK